MATKAMQVRLTDEVGNIYRWTVRRIPRVINCTVGQPNRVLHGWEFADHEGYARFSEGNWLDLVAMFNEVAANYGLVSKLS